MLARISFASEDVRTPASSRIDFLSVSRLITSVKLSFVLFLAANLEYASSEIEMVFVPN